MGWKFWKSEKSEAEKSLEELNRRSAASQVAAAPPAQPPPSPTQHLAPPASAGSPVQPPPPLKGGAVYGQDPATVHELTDQSGADSGFSMSVDEVFTITGRGSVVTGTVASGVVRVGQRITFTAPDGTRRITEVTGLEMFRTVLQEAKAGDSVGLLVRGVSRSDLPPGTVLTG